MREVYALLACFAISAAFYIAACNLVPALTPLDWPTPPAQPAVDTCETYTEQTIPEFIEGYVIFDTPQDSVLWQGGLVSSYDLGDVIEAVFPGHPYRIENTDKVWVVWVEGTNVTNQLTVFARVDGAKWYMGWMRQALMTYGTLTAEEHLELVAHFPSVERFNFLYTDYDSLQYIAIADAILGDCYAGRDWADFRFNPYEIPAEVIADYEAAGWDHVLH